MGSAGQDPGFGSRGLGDCLAILFLQEIREIQDHLGQGLVQPGLFLRGETFFQAETVVEDFCMDLLPESRLLRVDTDQDLAPMTGIRLDLEKAHLFEGMDEPRGGRVVHPHASRPFTSISARMGDARTRWWLITGSFNFTKAAEEHKAENLLIVESSELGCVDWFL